jgi:hypothetical protein
MLILSETNPEQECGIHIISCGPFIAYFECAPKEYSLVRLDGVHLKDENNIISFTAKCIDICGVDKICSCYPLFIQAPACNKINFCHVTICGGLVLKSGCCSTLTFEGNNELWKGPLIIDTGSHSSLTMVGGSEINVSGYALIKANTIKLDGNAKIVTSKYDLFYGCEISFIDNGNEIVVCNNQPPQGKLSQIAVYPTITSSFGVAGWFSIFPNDTEVNYLNIKLSNNCCTFCMFLNISPLNNGEEYNITPIIHPSPILLPSSSSGAKPSKPTYLIVEQGAKIFYNIYVSFSGCHVGISIYLYTQCSKEPYYYSTCTCVPKDSHLSVSLYGEPTYQVLLYEETQPQAVNLMENCGPYVKLNLNCKTPVEYFYLISSCINDNILTPTYSNINNGYCIYHVTYIC